jgi:hypothetical protein
MSLHLLITAWTALQHLAGHVGHLLASGSGLEWE